MHLFALGLNHHSAPLSLRERVAFLPERVGDALTQLMDGAPVQGAAILSTCNRTEVYCCTGHPEQVADWLAAYHGVALAELAPHLFALPGDDAVRHVFRVACGLDSMVLGEPQILGQMKQAFRLADEAGTLDARLHKLFQNAFAVAKTVRSTTAIGANVVSMAAAAVRIAERIFGSVSDQRVLCVGAGEMMQLCATHFAGNHPLDMAIANRTLAHAETLAARFGATAITLESLPDRLARYDVVLSCTGSPLPIIGLGMVERALRARRHRPMLMVDLAVPRDIETEVGALDDVFLYSVDDLAHLVESGLDARQQAVDEAETIIGGHVARFGHWLDARDAVPTIRALRQRAEALRAAEVERATARLARGEDPATVLQAMSQGLTNKLLHAPTQALHDAGAGQTAPLAELVRKLYQLD